MLEIVSLDHGWEFRRLESPVATAWTEVRLPHSPFLADLNGHGHWLGVCEYRRTLQVEHPVAGARYVLDVGAAMHSARVLIDGVEAGAHEGGYLPFEVDLTDHLASGAARVLTLVLDNRDNPHVPPGKPLQDLDFCWFGGLYRDVALRIYPPVHLTEAISAGEVAGGGVLVRTLELTERSARVAVKTQVRNATAAPVTMALQVELLLGNRIVASSRSGPITLAAQAAEHRELEIVVSQPRCWSPREPVLHRVRVTVLADDGTVLDLREMRFGIRRIAFSRSGGFVINGQRLRLRGTNRHQEHPYLGYAVPPAAQYRDARRIKEAGFDYVRLSHYPQAPEFLDACDELGIVVMNCIPGWQFLGGERFRAACVENARQLIRRDRNHPCVVLWELSLNETEMDEPFMAQLHAVGHEELPGDQMFTCGWIDGYDVFIHSRQHGKIHQWRNGDKALVVAEYGDWEYYAANEGFDQNTGAGVHAAWSNSRQFRANGERGLRQQAWNHVVALNDTLTSPAVLDGQWAMFDYARGYHPVRAACGVMDVFRLPKFSYHFYRSQRDADDVGSGWAGGPTVFIASHWTAASELRVVVFSNCEEVELSLNGKLLGRRRPERTSLTQKLPHPPFVFDLAKFEPGTLQATGWIAGQRRAVHQVATTGVASRIELAVDAASVPSGPTGPDLVFAHARICDADGNLCVAETRSVEFRLEGEGEIVGPRVLPAEAGVASVLVALNGQGAGVLTARGERLDAVRRELVVRSGGEARQSAAVRRTS
ncbi:glycoside hydrolase family 2 TIM barrel-domain containing protein [Opitutus terrae]|uniref:Glycoside hydrolase family 2 sugar binding n=1 Tax=Opitutus terrae (strain DSM 11246 / JCM 15787 / PB90-1) TaxID=452637 RepID=B1ZMQ6_OPITP|nr:glycoside hydrolase family 2 TIM barrel-domain containing protein [Opitutus terrae]ACB75334.1 glycoside hydrolase family 2 sugar binding [Opitutus terrae PB90-1]